MRQTPLPNSLWPDSCSTGSFPKSTVTFPDIRWQPWSDSGLLLDTPNYSRESGIWLGESAGNQWSPKVLETQTSSTSCLEMKADPSSLTKEALLDAVWQAGQRWDGGRGAEEVSPRQMFISSAAQPIRWRTAPSPSLPLILPPQSSRSSPALQPEASCQYVMMQMSVWGPLTYNSVRSSSSRDQNANKFITMETDVVLGFEEKKLWLSTPSDGQSFNEGVAFCNFRYIVIWSNISDTCIDHCSTRHWGLYLRENMCCCPH